MTKTNDQINKSDIDTIISVNKKAVELQTEVSDQYENILEEAKKTAIDIALIKNDMIDLKSDMKFVSKSHFELKVLIGSGIVSLIIQLILLFKK